MDRLSLGDLARLAWTVSWWLIAVEALWQLTKVVL